MEVPVVSEESAWIVALIAIALAVAAAFFMISPQLQSTTFQFLCETFYDINYFFLGPRPPIELCGPSSGANVSSSAPAKTNP